ncbi:macro domain-containing protein [Escherichia coli]|uniref:macro domain-containing protein n=1 Tax=Enterobacter hormaechei TaxID=158836 RepID=UPI001BDFB833|nr:macro domain-containing protein [Enterobacter hormaechei]MBT1900079.1 macro domain-containing protein [Enterobacter hormaechei subsp. xiangfangensis]MBW7785781.1 macro domain-containing protein [Enterobacter hormaechei]HDW1381178.1 macro domain-containing protein [Enterobacter asburiae]
MIEFVSGDFFEFDADIMVNTVNCVGVMGAGVALAFKKRYPEMFENYVEQCRSGIVRPGSPSVWVQKDIISKEIEIVNFPTKDHWKKPSEYHYIESGLNWLSDYLENKSGKIVTLPALGCGHGGLDWGRVRSMINNKLKSSPAHIFVFEPYDSVKAGRSKSSFSSAIPHHPSEVGVVKYSSDDYPKTLRSYTKKDLYYYPKEQHNFIYDYSIVCSSKPDIVEADAIRKFIEYCTVNKFSVLFGGTAFEKKLAFEHSAKGLDCCCFLPSGIYKSVKKISSINQPSKPHVMSIGNPLISFDKTEFMPSVFARISMSNKVVFFANNLSWLLKYKPHLEKISLEAYYLPFENRSVEDSDAVKEIGANEFSLDPQLHGFIMNIVRKD